LQLQLQLLLLLLLLLSTVLELTTKHPPNGLTNHSTNPITINMSLPEPASFNENPADDETDALLANELNRLSIKERDQVLYDIHGVADIVDEDTNTKFVPQHLELLKRELAKIPKKTAYEYAYAASPAYVNSRKLRLSFLRAESFDPIKAAFRMVAFFESKLALFGKSKLTKEICLEDLTADDMACLESGYFQFVGRDRAGRPILVCFPGIKQTTNSEVAENKVRSYRRSGSMYISRIPLFLVGLTHFKHLYKVAGHFLCLHGGFGG
jgi:hypothetical protein